MTERGPDHSVWSKVSWETNHIGELVPRTNSYVELASGLHYRDPNSQEWRASDPSFELTSEGYAVARRCQHQVIISPNLNRPDGIVVDLQTPDGLRLRSGIVGLNLFDPVSGKSLQIAAVRDVVGTQVASNEIVWFDAFDGLKADVRVRNERGQFHQDVLLREKLSGTQLASLGFDANTVRMEVWTEFLEAPEPVEQPIVFKTETNAAVRASMADPDEVDHVLKFGSDMQIGPGSAFIEGEPDKTTRVFKQWQETGGRRFLIETIRYRELLPLLEALPVKTAALNPGRSTSGLAANRLPPERATPSSAGASKALWIAKLDRAAPPPSSPHVVLDYPLSGGYTDYTLRGDTTYYVSGYVNLSGTTTIEGGTVIKFAPYNSGVYLQFNDTVRCLTGPYRPAVFTGRDDNTVGEVISGSTGNPSGYYASTAIYAPGWPTGDLHNLCIRYAMHAITWYYAASKFSDLQLVDCYYGIGRTYNVAPIHNVLLTNVVQAFWGYAVNYDIEHATVNQCAQLASVYGTYSQGYINLTNCVLANVSSWGSYNQLNANYNGHYNTPSLSQANDFPATDSPFETPVGAGSHYLAGASGFRDVGTRLINSELALALKSKTTDSPDVISANITSGTPLYPSATRDTDVPDLGYHYEPLDWGVGGKTVSANLWLTDGVVLGVYGASPGLTLLTGGSLTSQGTAARPNWIVRYNTVQEQAVSAWSASGGTSVVGGGSGISAQFTHWSLPANNGRHFYVWKKTVSFAFRDCEFSGGAIYHYGDGSGSLVNCLWNRVSFYLENWKSSPSHDIYNNLFRGSSFYVGDGDGGTTTIKDSFFDDTAISQFGNIVHDYNGYITGQNRLLPSPAPHDVVVSSMAYTPGPRGNFYQAQTDLVDAGSRSAADAGLSGYTTLANLESDMDGVDIGFHYYIGDVPTADPSGPWPTCRNQAVDITLTGSDPEGELLRYIVLSGPSHGTLSPATGTSEHRTYTPTAGYEGPDSFTFKVNDGFFDSAPATVTMEVGYQPTATPQSGLQTCRNTPLQITLTGSDNCGDPLTFIKVTDPAGGSLEPITQIPPNQALVTYTPNADYEGPDSFTFKVNDGFFDSDPATVSIEVGYPPVADDQSRVTHLSCPIKIVLTGSDGCDGQHPLTFSVVSQPSLGSLCGTPPNLTYEPGTTGDDSFIFKASDGVHDSDGTVFIQVLPDEDDTFWTDSGPTKEQLAEWLSEQGDTVANVSYTGALRARGIFGGGLSVGLPFGTGVILSSGDIHLAAGPNNAAGAGVHYGRPGDQELDALLDTLEPETDPEPLDTEDAAVLEFDLTPSNNLLQFDFVFASEEYPEFIASLKNDAVAIFVDGQNIAWVPGTTEPVCVFTVNSGRNSEYFQCNFYDCEQTFDFQFDGFTSRAAHPSLTASTAVQTGVPVHVKIVIADEDDDVYDSAVFIRAKRALPCAPPCP